MNIKPLFCSVTEQQMTIFDMVAPIIEKRFPKAFAFTDHRTNRLDFELKYDVKERDKTLMIYPDQRLLDKTCHCLTNLFVNNNLEITIVLMCDEYGDAWGIELTWQ